jgi:mannose/cellobiose epimerase-like protein (N-acyl-D-glucosamine 2-epimerase family)
MSRPKRLPAQLLSSPAATRGHAEQVIGHGVVCLQCKKRRPKGGWPDACTGDARVFMGGA